jgi:hypothetical protein
MLFEILVNIPSLVLYEIAWCIRFVVALSCLVVLFAIAIGIIGIRWRRDECVQLAPIIATSMHRAQRG